MNRGRTSNDAHSDGCGFLGAEEIERLLDGKLEDGRRSAFEHHLSEGCGGCALLAIDLDVFAEVARGGLREGEREELERRRPMLRARLRRAAARRRAHATAWRGWRPLTAAAVLVLAAGLAVLQLGSPGASISLPRGGSVAVEPMPFSRPPALRGETSATELWDLAAAAYENRRYREAARLLAEIDDSGDPGAGDAALYRGVSLLMIGDYAGAREALDEARALAERDDLPRGSIYWFSGLAALGQGDSVTAAQELQLARDAGGPYAEPAVELLDRLLQR